MYADIIKAAAAGRGGNYSKSSLIDLAQAMFNEPDCEITVYTKKGEGYVSRQATPGQDLRNNLIAPIVKAFGVDKAEMAKLSTIQTSRSGAEALADFSLLLIKEYVGPNGMGRKLTLPMTAADETSQSISLVKVAQEERETARIVKNDDGTYTPQPTGDTVVTDEHYKMIVKNRVPSWQKHKK